MNIVDVLGVTYKIKSSGLKTICLELSLKISMIQCVEALSMIHKNAPIFIFSSNALFHFSVNITNVISAAHYDLFKNR